MKKSTNDDDISELVNPPKKEGEISNILCPFCSAPWNESMIDTWHHAGGCDTCDFGSVVGIEIKCHKCKKLIYKKET